MNSLWDREEFLDPPSVFRGAPFWAWNNRLDVEQLKRQISYFQEMGMGGYHIHCRVGLDTEYLGDEFLDCVSECAKRGRELGLYTYLYDEDRWPSGAAGGKVTKDEAYRSRHLLLVPGEWDKEEKGRLLAVYRISLKDGCLDHYERVEKDAEGANIWRLYLQLAEPSPWFNNQTYLDTLNKKAVERFIEVTHETYFGLLGDEFGKTVPSIFTDEPQFERKSTLDFAGEKKAVLLPCTDGFETFYRERYGEDFLEHFPEIIWELPNGRISSARYQYHDGIAELFASSFADTIGQWCGKHGLMLTGHMMEEPTLLSQTSALGEAMRSYRGFQQPGIDMLCDWREYTTAKQAQSAAHQFGREGVLSELYGVTNWDFDFRGHKLQGDWQAALGVTRRVHHLSWASMAGEAKRDYPASIFYQSPWYREYKMVEDHFARVNTVLMRGKPRVRIGVIHPIESYWLHFGPKEQTAQVREVLEKNFQDVTEWLLFGNLDFDFLAESLLPGQAVHTEDGKFCVGEMRYDAVLIPGCETLRATTVKYLTEFAGQNGIVIFAGQEPEYVDAKKNPAGKALAKRCTRVPFDRISILQALEELREVEIRRPDGARADQFLCQMREDPENRWLFIANGRKPKNKDLPKQTCYQIRIRGCYDVELLDTESGRTAWCDVTVQNGWTILERVMDLHDSLLVRLVPFGSDTALKSDLAQMKPIFLKAEGSDEPESGPEQPTSPKGESMDEKESPGKPIRRTLPQPTAYHLEEPNVLLLDQCSYRFDGGAWAEKEEILRIDTILRDRLGYPRRMEAWPQPWVTREEPGAAHSLELRFSVWSEENFEEVFLALENPEKCEIFWNGCTIGNTPSGWYVDECIKTIRLGKVCRGENTLLLRLPFGKKTNLEWCYLLGSFGVRTAGRSAYLTALPQRLTFGDYTVQGLPFYAGNIRFETTFSVEEEGVYRVQISKFRAPLLKLSVDGGEWKQIAYAPYEADLGHLAPGVHHMEILSFGNRVNAFGTVHNCDETTEWFGPNEWRTEKERYAYEYQLKAMGILKAPVIIK